MSYQVKFSNQAKKFFRKLPANLEHYEGDLNKIRIGKLRALVDVDNSRKIIFVRVFDMRGRIYKR
jgi:mRNA-degrading endonuclease RelE of RelBE toxin-antitoxin system